MTGDENYAHNLLMGFAMIMRCFHGFSCQGAISITGMRILN